MTLGMVLLLAQARNNTRSSNEAELIATDAAGGPML